MKITKQWKGLQLLEQKAWILIKINFASVDMKVGTVELNHSKI